nr:hypothetical protein BaRGS_024486 [Batillaria attramentaria]
MLWSAGPPYTGSTSSVLASCTRPFQHALLVRHVDAFAKVIRHTQNHCCSLTIGSAFVVASCSTFRCLDIISLVNVLGHVPQRRHAVIGLALLIVCASPSVALGINSLIIVVNVSATVSLIAIITLLADSVVVVVIVIVVFVSGVSRHVPVERDIGDIGPGETEEEENAADEDDDRSDETSVNVV